MNYTSQSISFQQVLNASRHSVLLQNCKIPLPATTPYSSLMRKWVGDALAGISINDPKIPDLLSAAFIRGPVAYGTAPWFRLEIEGKRLGVSTQQLFSLLYSWLFSGMIQKKVAIAPRFFSNEYLFPIDLLIVYRHEADRKVFNAFAAFFWQKHGFNPTWNLTSLVLETLDLPTLLTSYCVYGQSQADMSLGLRPISELDKEKLRASKTLSRDMLRSRYKETTHLYSGGTDGNLITPDYFALNSGQTSDHNESQSDVDDSWYGRNQYFFSRLAAGMYDTILVEDASEDLDDDKGQDKNRAYTIVRVKGLEWHGTFIPCHKCVVKLRGLPHYRGNTNNLFDIIKEYSSYLFLHARARGESLAIPFIGPMLLSCDKLSLPFSPDIKRNCIGFFMEAITPQPNQFIHTCRVRNLTDPWRFNNLLQTVLRSSRSAGFQIPQEQLRETLANRISSFWRLGFSIDYCDLVLFISNKGDVNDIMLIDFERLSYSELVDEHHILLDTIIDIKTRLPKEMWPTVLPVLYNDENAMGEYLRLHDIRKLLGSTSIKRKLYFKTIRFAHMLLSILFHPEKASCIVADLIKRMSIKH